MTFFALLVIDRALYSYRNSPFYKRLQNVFNGLKKLLPDKVSIHSSDLAANFSIIPEPVTEKDPEIWLCIQKGPGGISSSCYWSSSEESPTNAWALYFNSGYQSNDYKGNTNGVRVIWGF